MKFDVVIGNPPYQNGSHKQSRMRSKPLWPLFVLSAFKLLKHEGYLSFIHPGGWRRPGHPILNLIKANNLLYLHTFNQQSGKRLFGVQVAFDVYVVQKSPYKGSTTYVGFEEEERVVDVSSLPFLPNMLRPSIERLVNSPSKSSVIHDNYYVSIKGSHEPIPDGIMSFYSFAKGKPRIMWFPSTKDRELHRHKVPKVIMQLTGPGKLHVYNDSTAQLVLTQFNIGIPVSSHEEACLIVEWFQKYGCILDAAAKWGLTRSHHFYALLNKDFYKTEFTQEEVDLAKEALR